MPNPYRELFAPAGTRAFALAGLLARLPLPMTGIGIITLVAQSRGSYALAGAVSATFVMTYALLSPQVSRWVDRLGQRRVLPVAALLSGLGLLLMAACTWLDGADWMLFGAALLAGCMPSVSAMVRARWTHLYRGQPQLQTAYSLETVLDEVSFIAGPPLAVGLSVALWPQVGLLAGAVLLLLGTALLAIQRDSEPPPVAPTPRELPVWRSPRVRQLTLLMVAMGVIVGTVDIVSVAFASEQGQPAAASLVLSAYAVGSCMSGLAFGALRWRLSLARQLLLGALATALSTLPLLLVDNIALLAAAVMLAGVFFAPTMIVAMALVERSVPERQLTEGLTWLLAGLNVGVALGAAGAGQWVDATTARNGVLIAMAGGLLVLLAALVVAGHRETSLTQPSAQ
ncbi:MULTISPECIES: MFS transporter [unclassified Pseudomonas]|uniref:MFS transporter n=1 Tax=unclassified Pseudomonas TaxID=196821 RepID=UPI002447AB23|nr:MULTISPECIES: MFS transporter [unclassified Pseudomonas]MDH0302390.1 MFS transporter [Pseudomonas sp. GD04091]MDH1984832.1 MFS transporter [Pseudomonas sp. GD03689]